MDKNLTTTVTVEDDDDNDGFYPSQTHGAKYICAQLVFARQ
jgi:hypothetical protein